MKRTDRHLSQSERILLHLLEFRYEPDSYTAPYQICQDGIGQALDILKNNVSRDLSILKKDGLVNEKLARVKGIDRRRNVYLVTEKGREVCKNIIDEIGNNRLRFRDGGSVNTLTINKAVKRLKTDHPNINNFHVFEWMKGRDVLDPDEFLPYFKDDKRIVELIAGAPVLKDFYGRDEELENILDGLSRPSPPIIVISGIAGIGKSTLAAKALEGSKGKYSTLWFNFHPWQSINDLKMELNKMMPGRNIRGDGLYAVFNELFSHSLDPLLIFDNCEKISRDLESVFSILLELKKRGSIFGAIFIGRERMLFYDVRDVINDLVTEVELGPLKEEDVQRINIDEEVYPRTGGHPLFMELHKKFGEEREEVKSFLEREIYSKLTSDEKALMKRLSVLLDNADKDVVLRQNDIDTLITLKTSHLVEETVDGKISAYSMIKDFIYENLSMDERISLHALIGRSMAKRGYDTDIEILYHYIHGKVWREALDALERFETALVNLHEDDRAILLAEFPEELVEKDELGRYHEIVGDIHLKAEEWNIAVGHYQKAMENDKSDPLLMEKLGEAQKQLHNWKSTLKSHKKALSMHRDEEDDEGIVRELLSLGTVYRSMGDMDRSEEMYQKAKDMIEEGRIDDIDEALSAFYNNMGVLCLYRSEYKNAETNLKA